MTREDEIEARFEAMRNRQLEPLRKQHFDDIAFLLRRSRARQAGNESWRDWRFWALQLYGLGSLFLGLWIGSSS